MDLDDKIDRAKFLKTSLTVGGGAVAATAGWGLLEFSAISGEPAVWKKTVCRYCGVGCGLMVGLNGDKIVRIKGDDEATNKGMICIKGLTLADLYNIPDRLTSPKIRKNGVLVNATWAEAFDLMERKFKAAIKSSGPDSVAFYGSGQLVSEESYTANKLFKAGLRTNNVDGNPRLCMASAAVGYTQTFGKDEPPGAYDDLDHAHCYFIIGANPYEAHPPIFQRIFQRREHHRNIKVICVDPRRTKTAEYSDIHLPVEPGTDMLLLNSMMSIMVNEKWIDTDFIEKHVAFNDGKRNVSMARFKSFLNAYTPGKVARELGISRDRIFQVADLFANSKATMSLWTMGINQRVQGVYLNNTLNSLHLITGQICRPGATPLSLTGQGNACGGVRDTGSLAHLLPGGRFIKKKKHRTEMEDLWKVPRGTISPRPGLDAVRLFRAMKKGDVKAALIMCTNPAQSMPNLSDTIEGLKKCFVVVSEITATSETAKYADVVLPSTLWIEREGVKGQTERRYQLVEKLKKPPPGVKSDLEILVEFSRRMGLEKVITAHGPQQVWDEWRKVSAHSFYNFKGITYERLKKERGLQWPCPTPNHPGTSRRFVGGDDPFVPKGEKVAFYGKPNNRATVFLRPYIASPTKRSARYPYILTTGRVISQWHTGTMTNKVKDLRRDSGMAKIYIHPSDARERRVEDDSRIRISSRYGSIDALVQISSETNPGILFASFYDAALLINFIVSDHNDPVSKQPEYKITAVNFEKLNT